MGIQETTHWDVTWRGHQYGKALSWCAIYIVDMAMRYVHSQSAWGIEI